MIGLTVVVFFPFWLPLFVGSPSLRSRASCVRSSSALNWAGNWGGIGSSSVFEITKSLQIFSSVNESASVQTIVRDIVDCVNSNCGNVPEKSISQVFSGHLLLLTCVEMYKVFWKLDKIIYKFSNLVVIKSLNKLIGEWKLIDQRFCSCQIQNNCAESLFGFTVHVVVELARNV